MNGIAMHVIDHEPHCWFLLDDHARLFLDVNCHHSFFSCSVLVRLDAEELADYQRCGRSYLHRLAERIHYSAPILTASTSPYKARNLSSAYHLAVRQAIADWAAQT
ncbi:hypothetical protein SAMN05216588_12111 [Pseudomonas flavescens]|uniref:Uncharacterized protein n=1 Tax=Phytopseudomonas flavescens TaxID=29435 RepID=A0A1G8M8R8_9GAMM|nr:hypothetical protein [Pseudomonas flavescens]SDI64379.1 hypothetical protein SAMN05216588_12111 [Pseudomonas flavescens]